MKASIIFNPKAGTRDHHKQIQDAGAYLSVKGWRIKWCETAYAGHATQLAEECAEQGEDIAIAVGGDGTINEVMNGLVGSQTALGVLPAGTGNVFAAEMNIPLPGTLPIPYHGLEKAAEALFTGTLRQVDVAKASYGDNQIRYFLMWAGIGLDAAISYSFELDKLEKPERKALGMFAWLITGLSVLGRFRGKQMTIAADHNVISGKMILTTVSNSQLYGRFWRLSPEAKLDDGLLDVVVMEGYSLWSSIKHVTLATLQQHTRNPDVHIFRTKKISIDAQYPVPIHLDAENVGSTPLEIVVVPKALNIVLPQDAAPHLFCRP